MGKLKTSTVKKRLAQRALTFKGAWHGQLKRYTFECARCGNEWRALGSSILQRSGCPICATRGRRLKTEEIKLSLALSDIFFEGEWESAHKKYSCTCSKGHSWIALGRALIYNKTGCPICNTTSFPKLSESKITAILSQRGLSLVGPWNGMLKDNRFKCSLGHEWEGQGQGPVKNRSGCPECYRQKIKNRFSRNF